MRGRRRSVRVPSWRARPCDGDGLMRVVVSGAGGPIGAALTDLLESQGDHVVRLTRGDPGSDMITWDPDGGRIDAAGLEGADAVVHLAAEPIAPPLTKGKRERVLGSRSKGTRLLASTLAGLDKKPDVLLSASAIGFYGDRGNETLTETSAAGTGFLSEVVLQWEAATRPGGGSRDPGRPRPHRLGSHRSGRCVVEAADPLQAGSGWPARLRSSMVELDLAHRRGARNGVLHRDRGAERGGEPHLTDAGDQRRVHNAIGCRAAPAICDRGTCRGAEAGFGIRPRRRPGAGERTGHARAASPERVFVPARASSTRPSPPSSEVGHDTGMSHPPDTVRAWSLWSWWKTRCASSS